MPLHSDGTYSALCRCDGWAGSVPGAQRGWGQGSTQAPAQGEGDGWVRGRDGPGGTAATAAKVDLSTTVTL